MKPAGTETNMSSEMPRQPLLRDPFYGFLLLTGASFGVTTNFLPAIFPALKTTFSATPEQLGRAPMLFFAAGIAYSLVGGWITGRLGLRRTAAFALATIALAWLFIAGATTYTLVLVGATLSGFGSVAVLVTSSAIISSCFPERRQSTFLVWGLAGAVGASIGPAIIGRWLVFAKDAGISWQFGIYGQIILMLLLAGWGLFLRPANPRADMTGHGESGSALKVMGIVLRSRAFYVASLWMFLHGLAQIGMISWIGQLYQERFSIDAAEAAYFLTANAVGFFTGRTILGWITARWKISELTVLTVCASGGGIFFGAAIAAPGYWPGIIAFFLSGVMASGDAPSALSYVGVRFTEHSATAFALLNGIGNIGAAAGPYFVGLMAMFVDIETGIWVMPLFMAALAASAVGWRIIDRTHEN